MLPREPKDLAKAKILYDEFAQEAVRLGGTIAAEHGIGRLKRHLMKLQYPPEMLSSMRELKRIFDPKGILNPGVLLPD
jgi:FAD/FMN-containing dehydrogenase